MNIGRGRNRKALFSANSINNNDYIVPSDQACEDNNNTERKIIRRQNEHQRRQKMALLTSSLRTLLPLEMIKGKRSVSDQLHEAVNYINHLKKETEALKIKRDRAMRDFCGSSEQSIDRESESTCSENCSTNTALVIRPCLDGIEIVVSCHFPLSKVLQILIEQGLDIFGCSSAKVNERLIHTIQSQVDDLSSPKLDLSELQQKLNAVLCRKVS